jgi:hypothetical protein
MNAKTMPRAWAKICANVYLYCGIAIVAMLVLALAGILPPVAFGAAYCALMPLVLAAGWRDVLSKITGNQAIQAEEKQAWIAATAPVMQGYQRVFRSGRPDWLREMGAIGVDLLAHTHKQQSAGRQSGRKAGGHKKPASSSSEDSEGGEPPAPLPLICTIHDLAVLLHVAAKTLQNQPKSALPPAIHITGCRGPRYHLRDVITWLDSFPVGRAKPPRNPQGKTGRPRLATPAQIAAVRGKGV